MTSVIPHFSRFPFPSLDPCRNGIPKNQIGCCQLSWLGSFWKKGHLSISRTPEARVIRKEFNNLACILAESFSQKEKLESYCFEFAEDLRNERDFNLYWEGKHANYWLQLECSGEPLITIHIISKKDKGV